MFPKYCLPARLKSITKIWFLLQHKTGLWASLGSELCFENGVIIKSINPTGHFLLYDARLEDPDGMLLCVFEKLTEILRTNTQNSIEVEISVREQ